MAMAARFSLTRGIEESMVREIREESGMELKKYQPIGMMRFDNVDKMGGSSHLRSNFLGRTTH
jgi:8-oxo-dGTP pyrophosphatase MutT (NUDIX family)